MQPLASLVDLFEQSEAIRSNRKQSEAIRSNQKQSEAIRQPLASLADLFEHREGERLDAFVRLGQILIGSLARQQRRKAPASTSCIHPPATVPRATRLHHRGKGVGEARAGGGDVDWPASERVLAAHVVAQSEARAKARRARAWRQSNPKQSEAIRAIQGARGGSKVDRLGWAIEGYEGDHLRRDRLARAARRPAARAPSRAARARSARTRQAIPRGNQRVIGGHSEGTQRAIRGQSEGNQRAIGALRGQSEGKGTRRAIGALTCRMVATRATWSVRA